MSHESNYHVLRSILRDYADTQYDYIMLNLNTPTVALQWAVENLAHTIFLLYPQLRDS
jgi:hypothetical protein